MEKVFFRVASSGHLSQLTHLAMDPKERNELREKVLQGVKLAFQRHIAAKKLNNSVVAVSRNGKVITVKAVDLVE